MTCDHTSYGADGPCPDCIAFIALAALCEAEQQSLERALARHLTEACPFAERDLPCACKGYIPGSLAAFRAGDFKGWALPDPDPDGKMPSGPGPPAMEGPLERDGSRLVLSRREWQARERLMARRPR